MPYIITGYSYSKLKMSWTTLQTVCSLTAELEVRLCTSNIELEFRTFFQPGNQKIYTPAARGSNVLPLDLFCIGGVVVLQHQPLLYSLGPCNIRM